MVHAIQRAYYLEARNPSDYETLIELAGELGIDTVRFAADIRSPAVEALLQADFAQRRALGVRSFPTLLLRMGQRPIVLTSGYAGADVLQAALKQAVT
jgi:putative protein-disulfide isomerase